MLACFFGYRAAVGGITYSRSLDGDDGDDIADGNDDVDDAGDENIPCRCPYFIDPASNDLTGRVIEDNQVKELIVQLHNEVSFVTSVFGDNDYNDAAYDDGLLKMLQVRSKIARGACDQPKAGCMGPVVSVSVKCTVNGTCVVLVKRA